MELRYYAQTLSPDLTDLELYILSDLHYGNPFCDVKRFTDQVGYIKNTDNAYVIFNGDLCEMALKGGKCGDVYSQKVSPQEQRDWAIETLMPIKHKVLGLTTGNHEDRIYKETGMDISKDIAKSLNTPYDPDGFYLKLSFGSGNSSHTDKPFVYWINCSHGYGGARTKSAKAVKAERLASYVQADVTAMSHDHVVNASYSITLSPDNRTTPEIIKDANGNDVKSGFMVGKVVARRGLEVKTNAFLKWGGYGRKGGYSPSDLTTPTVLLAGSKKPWPDPEGERNSKPQVRIIV